MHYNGAFATYFEVKFTVEHLLEKSPSELWQNLPRKRPILEKLLESPGQHSGNYLLIRSDRQILLVAELILLNREKITVVMSETVMLLPIDVFGFHEQPGVASIKTFLELLVHCQSS